MFPTMPLKLMHYPRTAIGLFGPATSGRRRSLTVVSYDAQCRCGPHLMKRRAVVPQAL